MGQGGEVRQHQAGVIASRRRCPLWGQTRRGSERELDFRFAPERRPGADIAGGRMWAITGREQVQHTNALLDHFVGVGEQRGRNLDSKYLCRLRVDD